MARFAVLIVDDERTLARSIKLFLEEQGYEAEVASDGDSAIELLEKMRPDLVFLDLRLPKVSGLDLLKRVRAYDPSVAAVMMTAHGTIASAVEAMKLGAFDYITKPIDLEELRIVIERARDDRRLRQEVRYYREKGRVYPQASIRAAPDRTHTERIPPALLGAAETPMPLNKLLTPQPNWDRPLWDTTARMRSAIAVSSRYSLTRGLCACTAYLQGAFVLRTLLAATLFLCVLVAASCGESDDERLARLQAEEARVATTIVASLRSDAELA